MIFSTGMIAAGLSVGVGLSNCRVNGTGFPPLVKVRCVHASIRTPGETLQVTVLHQ